MFQVRFSWFQARPEWSNAVSVLHSVWNPKLRWSKRDTIIIPLPLKAGTQKNCFTFQTTGKVSTRKLISDENEWAVVISRQPSCVRWRAMPDNSWSFISWLMCWLTFWGKRNPFVLLWKKRFVCNFTSKKLNNLQADPHYFVCVTFVTNASLLLSIAWYYSYKAYILPR